MFENHLETCLYHLVGIIEPVFKRLSATFDTPCITGCIFKMCRNFTDEVVEQRRRLKALKKKCSSKLFFDRMF
jgi:hypothetical protein